MYPCRILHRHVSSQSSRREPGRPSRLGATRSWKRTQCGFCCRYCPTWDDDSNKIYYTCIYIYTYACIHVCVYTSMYTTCAFFRGHQPTKSLEHRCVCRSQNQKDVRTVAALPLRCLKGYPP